MSEPSRSVFIIDDDASVRRGMARLLRASGLDVATFSSAAEFLQETPVDGNACILLDVMMPRMSGPELQRELADRGIDWPIVFLSAHIDVPTTVRVVQRGAVDVLTKPVDSESLLEVVARALDTDLEGRRERAARESLLRRIEALSPREHEVMTCVIAGWLSKQIAHELGIALDTVKIHRRRVMDKMEAGSVAELVRAAELAGVAPREGSP